MNIFIPNYQETFRVKEDGKLRILAAWRLKNPVDGKEHDVITPIKNNDVEVKIPEGTVMEITSIRVRRSEYRNYITFVLHNDIYTGIQYKTVGKLKIDLFEDNNGFKQLKELNVEIMKE